MITENLYLTNVPGFSTITEKKLTIKIKKNNQKIVINGFFFK